MTAFALESGPQIDLVRMLPVALHFQVKRLHAQRAAPYAGAAASDDAGSGLCSPTTNSTAAPLAQ